MINCPFKNGAKNLVLEGVDMLLTNRLAAHYAGIDHTTLEKWLQRGRKERKEGKETEHVDFLREMNKRRANKAVKLLQKIDNPGKYWLAADKLLARCFREDYGDDAGIIKELLESQKKIREFFEKKSGELSKKE